MEQIGYPWFMNCRCVLREEGLFVCLFRVSKAEECIINKSKEGRRRESEKKNRIIVCSEDQKKAVSWVSLSLDRVSFQPGSEKGRMVFLANILVNSFLFRRCVGVCCEFQQ